MQVRVSPRVGFMMLVVLSAFVAGCSDLPTTTTTYAPYSQTDLRVGTGDTVLDSSTVSVNYTGWLYDATKPDSKGPQFGTSGGTPFSFTLNTGQVIPGWDQGVLGMKVGGLRRLVIPPSLGYGSTRNGQIPPNATLVFEIELLSVQ
jgi:FKBP-type peptidyl-prolyl cis-trans isomerase